MFKKFLVVMVLLMMCSTNAQAATVTQATVNLLSNPKKEESLAYKEFIENSITPIKEESIIWSASKKCTNHDWKLDLIISGDPVYKCSNCEKRSYNIGHIHNWVYVGEEYDGMHLIKCYCGLMKCSDLKGVSTPNLNKLASHKRLTIFVNAFERAFPDLPRNSEIKRNYYISILKSMDINYQNFKIEIKRTQNRLDVLKTLIGGEEFTV